MIIFKVGITKFQQRINTQNIPEYVQISVNQSDLKAKGRKG